jgi:hypothetical protein
MTEQETLATPIKLELPIDAVNMILGALGELPAKTNAMALMLLIKEQADPQVPPETVEQTLIQ